VRRIIVAANKALAERLKKLHEPQGERTLQELLAEVKKIQGEDLHFNLHHEPPESTTEE
jgi:regulator of protease activity HflC (stomatin/prohibitin superfamily)